MNDRSIFIKRIKEIDDFYLPKGMGNLSPHFRKELEDKGFKSFKELFLKEDIRHYLLSHVNIALIEQITLHDGNTKELPNPFKEFYTVDDEIVRELFYLLAKTHKALRYFDEYSSPMKDLEQRNNHANITKKIEAVLAIMLQSDKAINVHFEKIINDIEIDTNYTPAGVKAYDYLVGLKNSLKNNHYTERHVFENLLFEMYSLLEEQQLSKEQIFRTVNSIISIYFGRYKSDDDKPYFTTKMNLTKFKKLNYQYETKAGIDLTHSTPSKLKTSF